MCNYYARWDFISFNLKIVNVNIHELKDKYVSLLGKGLDWRARRIRAEIFICADKLNDSLPLRSRQAFEIYTRAEVARIMGISLISQARYFNNERTSYMNTCVTHLDTFLISYLEKPP